MVFKVIGVIFLLGAISLVQSACNICDPTTQVACHNENSFKLCYEDNKADATVYQCPLDTVCVQDDPAICVAKQNAQCTTTPSCLSECGKCSNDKRFACMSKTGFSLCYGTDSPSGRIISCPDGKVCSRDAPNYCVDSAQPSSCIDGEIGSASTTTTTTTPTPIVPTSPIIPTPPIYLPTDANGVCRRIGTPGRYAVANDNTCSWYYYCYYRDGILFGQKFVCPGRTHFNPALQICVPLNQSTCFVS